MFRGFIDRVFKAVESEDLHAHLPKALKGLTNKSKAHREPKSPVNEIFPDQTNMSARF